MCLIIIYKKEKIGYCLEKGDFSRRIYVILSIWTRTKQRKFRWRLCLVNRDFMLHAPSFVSFSSNFQIQTFNFCFLPKYSYDFNSMGLVRIITIPNYPKTDFITSHVLPPIQQMLKLITSGSDSLNPTPPTQ